MRRLLLAASILAAFASSPAFATIQAVPPEIEKLLALPEDEIDIGIAALTFAHDAYPDDTDIQAYSKRIDQLVEEVRTVQAEAKARNPQSVSDGPDDTMLAISEVFYNRQGFKYDHSPEANTNALNKFLPGVLERKLGNCATMPMLYMAIAQRLGLQMYIVQTPRHNFLRIPDPRSKIRNFEATSNGTITDARYIKEENITDIAVKHGTFMRTMTHHQYLAELLSINGGFWLGHGQETRAIKYFERALEIDPKSYFPAFRLTEIYLRKSIKAADDFIFSPKKYDKKLVTAYLDKSLFYRNKLTEMGVRMEDLLVAPDAGPRTKSGEVNADAKTQ